MMSSDLEQFRENQYSSKRLNAVLRKLPIILIEFNNRQFVKYVIQTNCLYVVVLLSVICCA